MENKQSHGGTQNTFIFGVLVGVLITLLFTTKKGRQLLRMITDEGIDKLSHWEEIVEKLEKNVSKVKETVKEEMAQDEVYENESVLGEGQDKEIIEEEIEEEVEEIQPSAEEEVVEVVEERDEIEEEIEEVDTPASSSAPASVHKIERIQLHKPTLKKTVKKVVAPAPKKEEKQKEEDKPKRRLFKGIRKKS